MNHREIKDVYHYENVCRELVKERDEASSLEEREGCQDLLDSAVQDLIYVKSLQ